MKRKSLIILLALIALPLLAAVGNAWSRSGSDLGSRVASLESQVAALGAQVAANTAQIGTNTAQVGTNTAAIASNTAHQLDTGNAHSHDARYIRDSGLDTRAFFGTFDGAGNIVSGSDFTVVRNGVGDYTVTFNTPFTSSPSVQALAGHGGMTFSVNSTTAHIVVYDNAATPQDSAVLFWVAGAQ